MSLRVRRRRLALVRFFRAAASVAAVLALNKRMISRLWPAIVKASVNVNFVRPKTRKNFCWMFTKLVLRLEFEPRPRSSVVGSGAIRCARRELLPEGPNQLKIDVAFPFLLEVLDDGEQEVLPEGAVVELVRLVESYVFRRAIAGIPNNILNKTFASLALRTFTLHTSVSTPCVTRRPPSQEPPFVLGLTLDPRVRRSAA